MNAGRILRIPFAVGFALCTAAIASAQNAQVEAQLQLELARLRLMQAQKAQPKAKPPIPPQQAKTMPEGAVARVGDSRLRHAALPRCVTFSPDGKRVLSGGEDGMLRVWDLATGQALDAIKFPSASVTALRYTAGGSKLAVQLNLEKIRLLDAATLKPVSESEETAPGDFAVSADGEFIAAVGGDGLLHVTELGTQLPKLELPAARNVAFHPDGRTVAVADDKGKVTLHMLAGGKPVLTFDHGGRLDGLVFRPDGKRVATGGGGVLKVWDVSDRKAAKLVAEVKGAGQPKAWITDDRIAAASAFTGGGAFAAGVYDLKGEKWLSRLKEGMWVGRAHGVAGEWAVSPDGTKAVATSTGGLRIYMWDLTTGQLMHAEDRSFPSVALLAPSRDGKGVFMLAGTAAFLWPAGTGDAAPAGTLPGSAVEAAAAGGRLAVATPDAVLVYDDFDSAKPLAAKPSRTLSEHVAGCRAIAVSPDGKRIAYSGDAEQTVIADAATGEALRVLPVKTRGLGLAFSPDGKTLAMIGRDGWMRLWPVERPDGKDEAVWSVRVQRGQKGTVAFSPDGKLVAASSSGLLKIVDATDGKEAFSVGNLFDNGLFQQVAFSPDGRFLVAATEGATGGVIVWEVATRTAARRFATGFGTVYRLGMLPDGVRIASAGIEEAVTLWDLRPPGAGEKPDELFAAWAKLDSLDAATGIPGALTLAAAGNRGVTVIAAGFEETLATQKKIAGWVKDLGSDEFAVREKATKELTALGARALPAVSAAERSESAEVRTRVGEIMTKFNAKGLRVPDHGLAGDTLRLFRAVQVLEDVGTPEAKALLGKIADRGGRAGDEAKAALKRLEKR